ncbi:multidrug transporter subunit MdtA [Massilia phosphatilytica]|nr:multidrug transporter subunit MdtA [Massilia phosphatilytica]
MTTIDRPSHFDDGRNLGPGMTDKRRWRLAAGVLGLTACVGGCGQQVKEERRGGAANRPVPVAVAAAGKQDVRVVQSALGTVVPQASVVVRARVGGQLQKVLFQEGQLVRAGDLLAEIDPRPFIAQLTQAEGQLKRDLALLKNAQADLARYQGLRAHDSISEQALDNQAALVQQYQGTVQADQGVVDNARLQLSFARITAPVSGRIGLRQVDVGNIVAPNDTAGLAVITAVQPIAALFSLPEDQLPAIAAQLSTAQKQGRVLAVEAWDRSGTRKLAQGRLETIDNQIDPATGTIRFKAQFANADGALYPNQFVNVRLLVETKSGLVVAPNVAIQNGNQGPFVYVVGADKTVALRPVTLGPVDGDKTAVTTGLEAGEQVVVTGTDRLRNGAKVVVPETRKARTTARAETAG